jgi:hypothetical protein
MFGNLGTHINKFPSGRWGYVGTLPIILADIIDARTSDVMGCRAFKDENGNLKAYKFPTFETEKEARDFAESKNVEVRN